MAIGPPEHILKTYSSAACNVTLTHKCVLGCTTPVSNILNLNLKP